MILRNALLALMVVAGAITRGAEFPKPAEGDYVIPDFHFRNGQTLPELKVHYRTIGKPQSDDKGVVRNAVLILHGTTGNGGNFLAADFGGELFGKGQVLDAERYFIILPDDIGHGKSSKPSDGLHGRFPNYGYEDMVEAEYKLVTDGLKVNHLRVIIGTSMGGMHTWMWGEEHPDFMDALLPLASLPEQISGRNRHWRKMISDVIRTDPEWKEGDYTSQPRSLRFAAGMLFLMMSNPAQVYQKAPTREQADKMMDDFTSRTVRTGDANNFLYAVESSYDYDPAPALEKIKAPLVAVNFADDLINPTDLGILEKQIKRVKNGKAVVVPESAETNGHLTHSRAKVWKQYLEELLKESEHK